MTRPLSDEALAALERTVLLGTLRAPEPPPEAIIAPDESHPAVAALAFVAQQRRLTTGLRPRVSTIQTRALVEDTRRPMPEALRARFRRLVATAGQHRQTGPLVAVTWLLRDRGFRIHPFDEAIASGVATLRTALTPPAGSGALDDRAWLDGGPQERIRWLRVQRAANPEAARATLEEVWSGERAEIRARLLEALDTGLGPADRPFLEKARQTRSGKVRAAAERLLAQLPTGEGARDRLEMLAAALVARKAAFPPRATLALANGPREPAETLGAALRDVELSALAARLDVETATFTRPHASAERFIPDLLIAAARRGPSELVEPLAARAAALTIKELGTPFLEALARFDEATFDRVLGPSLEKKLPVQLAEDPEAADTWARTFERPLPRAASLRLRTARGYLDTLANLLDPDEGHKASLHLSRLAALVHPEDAGAAAEQLKAEGPAAAPALQRLFAFMDALDRELRPSQAPVLPSSP